MKYVLRVLFFSIRLRSSMSNSNSYPLCRNYELEYFASYIQNLSKPLNIWIYYVFIIRKNEYLYNAYIIYIYLYSNHSFTIYEKKT